MTTTNDSHYYCDHRDLTQIHALVFFQKNADQHLACDRGLLIERAIKHLMDQLSISKMTAERAVCRALAEHESRNERAYIDTNESTAFAVMVRDPLTNCTRVFTVADLMRLVRTPALAAMPTPSKRKACAGHYLPL